MYVRTSVHTYGVRKYLLLDLEKRKELEVTDRFTVASKFFYPEVRLKSIDWVP